MSHRSAGARYSIALWFLSAGRSIRAGDCPGSAGTAHDQPARGVRERLSQRLQHLDVRPYIRDCRPGATRQRQRRQRESLFRQLLHLTRLDVKGQRARPAVKYLTNFLQVEQF